MKIICIGRNYIEHIKELHNTLPQAPAVFMKPQTAILQNNAPFIMPSFDKNIHHELEVVLHISKKGKNISEDEANAFFDKIALGIDFTARDLQTNFKEKSFPWLLAKGFDGSAPISNFFNKENFSLKNLEFHLLVNQKMRQKGNTSDMIFSFEKIISYVSKFITLEKGDLLFTGTPQGVASVNVKDRIEAYLESEKVLDFQVSQ